MNLPDTLEGVELYFENRKIADTLLGKRFDEVSYSSLFWDWTESPLFYVQPKARIYYLGGMALILASWDFERAIDEKLQISMHWFAHSISSLGRPSKPEGNPTEAQWRALRNVLIHLVNQMEKRIAIEDDLWRRVFLEIKEAERRTRKLVAARGRLGS